MPWSDFVHLHNHTQYSLLDGACRIFDLVAAASFYKMPALAITDHGNMFGAIEFYLEAQRQGVKPIIGSEVYIAPTSRFEKKYEGLQETSNHFILLAKDEEGYRNLMQLISSGYLEGFYYRPRIDKEILSQKAKGLIGLTACLKGQLACLIQQNQFNEALKKADEFSQIFGKGNFYLELMENGIPEQKIVNQGLLKISKELNLPIVATNDTHYLTKDKARAHEALLCIQTQTTLDDPKRMRFQTQEFYFKSPEEMKELFKELPQAISNTIEIAEKCNLELNFNQIHLPRYETPVGKNKDDFLRELCEVGLAKRFSESFTDSIKERLEHELKIIKDMGFSSYFLIVWDFIHFAKQNNIPVGPGRGSCAGSLVSYLLGITDINPLKYDLLFERFLNPERLSLPDIDIDFCYERRNEVIDYVTKKYGQNNVAQIITFGTMQPRAVIRDVGRVMAMPYSDVDKIAKLVPPDPNINLKQALEDAELNSLYKNDPQIKELIDMALSLEGLARHASIHAAGVVISDKPLTEYTPLFKTTDDQITTGYAMGSLEKNGLLKMDFLGLRTLTVIAETLKIIQTTQNKIIEIDKIPLDDSKTFKLLCAAQSLGVFQLESAGMRDLLTKLQPSNFEDLIALLALYRPGPIGSGMLDDFINRKHKRIAIRYDHKKLEPILKQTYGIIVYQEQVMRIASELAGFSLAQADLLRRAMSKKIPEVMERQRLQFSEGCVKNGINKEIAEKIFDLIVYFSGYGFNKSHSAAYAMISYRTAYLKAHFPTEFMTALLTSEKDNPDKVAQYVAEAMRMGIKVLAPDINESDLEFKVFDKNNIRFGLIAIKNVGQGAIESILNARVKNSKFKSLDDFCEHVDLRLVNKRVLESLVKAGVCDSWGLRRAQLVSTLDSTLERSSKMQKEKERGQLSFFDLNLGNGFTRSIDIPDIKEWPEPQLLSFEKEMLGFYISGHPLARYSEYLKRFSFSSTQDLKNLGDGKDIKLTGLISKIKHATTRAKNEKMAILKVEDLQGEVEVLVFPKAYKQYVRAIQPNRIILVKGRLNLKEENPKIIASQLIPLEEFYKLISGIEIDLSGVRENIFASVKEKLSLFPGKVPVYLHLDTNNRSRVKILVGQDLFVQPNEELVKEIEALVGQERFSLTL